MVLSFIHNHESFLYNKGLGVTVLVPVKIQVIINTYVKQQQAKRKTNSVRFCLQKDADHAEY